MQYRSMLDSQIQISKDLKSNFGSMTNVEKRMNRADLLAFKAYDNTTYSLIPGINHNYVRKSQSIVKKNYDIDD